MSTTIEDLSDILGSVVSDTKLGVDPSLRRKLQVLNIAAFTATMLVNYLDSELTGNLQKRISEDHATKLQPAGWAFSIWGLIFALVGGFTVY